MTADVSAICHRLVPNARQKHQIAKLIADAEADRLAANKISATRTLKEDRRAAFNDPRRFVTADGKLQPITNWTEEMAAAVASIEVVRRNLAGGDGHSDTVVKIRFWNKVQALELLHKHFGLLQLLRLFCREISGAAQRHFVFRSLRISRC